MYSVQALKQHSVGSNPPRAGHFYSPPVLRDWVIKGSIFSLFCLVLIQFFFLFNQVTLNRLSLFDRLNHGNCNQM